MGKWEQWQWRICCDVNEVNKHHTAAPSSSLIESMLGCLGTKGEVTCALLSHTVLLSPYNASRNGRTSLSKPLKHMTLLNVFLPKAKQNYTFLLVMAARKEKPEHSWFSLWALTLSFHFKITNHRIKLSHCTLNKATVGNCSVDTSSNKTSYRYVQKLNVQNDLVSRNIYIICRQGRNFRHTWCLVWDTGKTHLCNVCVIVGLY